MTDAELEAYALANGGTVRRCGPIMSAPAPTVIDEPKDEKAFQAAVVKEAEKLCWLVFHPWLSIRSKSGYPDLTMARGTRVIFAELKTEKCVLSAAQQTWRDVLDSDGHHEYYLWRPSDWAAILKAIA